MTAKAEIRPLHHESVSHLTLLRARSREGSTDTSWTDEVERATRRVLEAAQAAQDVVLAKLQNTDRHPATTRFLSARMARLRTAAAEVQAAAKEGDLPALRRRLSTFTALTEATWTIQQSFIPAAGSPTDLN
jgi:hypothetical protein